MVDMGCTWATVFTSSGYSLLLTSDVDKQEVRICSIESVGSWHRSHAADTPGLSRDSLSFVKKSLVRNFKWTRSFLTSSVLEMLCRMGCGLPDSPDS